MDSKMTDKHNNAFLHPRVQFSDALSMSIDDRTLNLSLENAFDQPLKVFLIEQRKFDGQTIPCHQLLLLAYAPRDGWSNESIKQVLSNFYYSSHKKFQLDQLQVFIGNRWLGRPTAIH